MNKILLINPPPTITSISDFRFQNVPLSLVYVGGYARSRGFDVKIIDAYNELLPAKQVLERVVAEKPAIVGITCDATRFELIMILFRNLRELLPEALLVAGGSFPSFRQADLFPWVDAIVKGEGEAAFAEIAENFRDGKPLEGIKGIFVKAGEGYSFTGDREPIRQTEMDEYFRPAWDLVDLRHNFFFWGRRVPVATIITSRGCPEDCSYCCLPPLWGHRHRQVSAARVLDELALLYGKYGVREIYFKDNLFTFNKRWVTELCEGLLARGIKLSWSCGTGVKYVTPELLALMKKAGCHTINFGFESGTQRILDSVSKNITPEQSLSAAQMTRAAGIQIFGFFMIGFPTETLEEIENTITLAKKISPDMLMFAFVTPFPGTRLWYSMGMDKAGAEDWDWRDYNWYRRSSTISSLAPKELLKLRWRALSTIRNGRYWIRYILKGNPGMLGRQLWRVLWTFKTYKFHKYKGVRNDVPQRVL
jgi:anaerobic magnesium-protoporphyrin IX monomethyl ester cyclase